MMSRTFGVLSSYTDCVDIRELVPTGGDGEHVGGLEIKELS